MQYWTNLVYKSSMDWSPLFFHSSKTEFCTWSVLHLFLFVIIHIHLIAHSMIIDTWIIRSEAVRLSPDHSWMMWWSQHNWSIAKLRLRMCVKVWFLFRANICTRMWVQLQFEHSRSVDTRDYSFNQLHITTTMQEHQCAQNWKEIIKWKVQNYMWCDQYVLSRWFDIMFFSFYVVK